MRNSAEKPSVSVVVPNYNHGRFLDQRMNTILGQTHQDFEVIILDDASTDNSLEVIRKFKDDPRVTVVQNQENSGSPFKQWNKGVRLTKGKYVWIAESDDYSDERFLASLVSVMEKHPNVGLAYSQSWLVDDSGDRIGQWMPGRTDPKLWNRDFILSGKAEFWKYMVDENTVANASSVIFQKALYESAGFADESLRLMGDYMMWLRMVEQADVAFVAEPLNFFRKHSASVRSVTLRNGVYVEEAYRILQYMRDTFPIPLDMQRRVADRILKEWVAFFMSKFGRHQKEQNRRIRLQAQAIEKHLTWRFLKYSFIRFLFWVIFRLDRNYILSDLDYC